MLFFLLNQKYYYQSVTKNVNRLQKKKKKKIVSWCFEPSQPQRITVWLKKKQKKKK